MSRLQHSAALASWLPGVPVPRPMVGAAGAVLPGWPERAVAEAAVAVVHR